MNELLCLIILIISMTSIFLLNKYYQKEGLYFLLIIFSILSFITAFNQSTILNFDTMINFPIHISLLITLYLIYDKYGIKEKKNLIYITVTSLLISMLFILLTTSYAYSITDNIAYNYKTLFIDNYNLFISIPSIIILDILLIIPIFKYLKEEYDVPFLTLSLSLILISFIDSMIISTCTYITKYTFDQIINFGLANYVLKLITILLYLPFISIINKKKVKK